MSTPKPVQAAEIEHLRAEVAALRAEVHELRSRGNASIADAVAAAIVSTMAFDELGRLRTVIS